ncbi:MAG: hypothetical protein M1830_001261, partial [Pleopsidium flavum]
MEPKQHHQLLKGHLLPPHRQTPARSHSEPSAPQADLVIETKAARRPKIISFSSSAIPQPFLNPAILTQKVAREK